MDKEYFNSSEYNKFEEYKRFSAEIYRLPLEYPKTAPELPTINEENESLSKNKPHKKDTSMAEKLKDKLSQTTAHATTHISTGVATTALTGTIAAVTVFTPIGATLPDIEINKIIMGENSVYYSIFAEDLNQDFNYSIEIKNNKHKFSFPLVEGENENVVNGLLPGYEYTISMLGTDKNNITVEYKKQKFYTLKEKLPTVDFAFVKHPRTIRGYSLEYNIDVSEEKEKFDSFFVNVTCNNTLLQKTSIVDGKINGFIDQVPTGEIDFSVFGIVKDKQIFIKSKQYVVEEPIYTFSTGSDYIFDKNGKIKIPFTISGNEMADSVISKVQFDLDFHTGYNTEPESVYKIKTGEESYFTLSETPPGATSVSITPKIYISGGVNGVPVEYLKTIEFVLPYKYDVVSTEVFLDKADPTNKTLMVDFAMHDKLNTKLFVEDSNGSLTEVVGNRLEKNIDSLTGELNLSYYLQYEDGTYSQRNQLNIPIISVPTYTFNYMQQINKAFYTYNELDGTYNAYFDMRSTDSNPALNNNDLYYKIILTDTTGYKQCYSLTDDIAIIKNLMDEYTVTYQVCQDIGEITYIYEQITLSGTLKPMPKTSAITGMLVDTSPSEALLTLSLDTHAALYNLDTFWIRLSDGTIIEPPISDFIADTYGNYKLNLSVSPSITNATVHVEICDNAYKYNELNEMGLIIGLPYTHTTKNIDKSSATN